MTAFAFRSLGIYMPDRAVKVSELPELDVLTDVQRQVCADLGIDEIRADDSMSTTDLAAMAARDALAGAGLEAADLDGLVLIESRAPHTLLSSEPARLQALLGANRAVTFSVGGLGCASVGPGLITARGLLAGDQDLHNVLVLHGSKPATPARYRHPVTVNGDGGVAVIAGRTGRIRVLDIIQESNGEYWDLFGVEYRDRPFARWREECADPMAYSFRLAIETRNRVTDLHRRILDRNKMRAGDVAVHLAHNLSQGALRFTEEVLDVTMAPACRDNLRQFGHLGAADVLVNLHSELAAGRIGEGQRALLLTVSPAAAWSLLLIEIGEERTI